MAGAADGVLDDHWLGRRARPVDADEMFAAPGSDQRLANGRFIRSNVHYRPAPCPPTLVIRVGYQQRHRQTRPIELLQDGVGQPMQAPGDDDRVHLA